MSNSTKKHTGNDATYTAYVTGFVLALILTIIPFGIVGFDLLSPVAALLVVAIAAVIQILVHMYFFLHLDVSEEKLSVTQTGFFTALLLVLFVGGTIWLFWGLHARVMLGH